MPGGLVMIPSEGGGQAMEEDRELTLRREARTGNIEAVYEFYLYLKQQNDKAKLAERIAMLRQAAMGGVAGAMVDFATAHETGDGLEKSPVDTYAWLTVAAAFGRGDLEERRAALAETLGELKAETAQRRAQKILTDMTPEARKRARRA